MTSMKDIAEKGIRALIAKIGTDATWTDPQPALPVRGYFDDEVQNAHAGREMSSQATDMSFTLLAVDMPTVELGHTLIINNTSYKICSEPMIDTSTGKLELTLRQGAPIS